MLRLMFPSTKFNQRIGSEHLTSDWLKLENCIKRRPEEVGKDLEAVVASIQLFGTNSQILAAKAIANDIALTGSANLEKLLVMLRNDLREELQLEKCSQSIQFLRMQDVRARGHAP